MHCPLCRTRGRSRQLQTYQINLREAVRLCEEPSCSYPVGVGGDDNVAVFDRGLSEVESLVKTEGLSVPKSQRILQAQASSRLQAYGQTLQTNVSATQAGSPQLVPRRCKPLVTQNTFPPYNHGRSSRLSRTDSDRSIGSCKSIRLSESRTQVRNGNSNTTGEAGQNPMQQSGNVRTQSVLSGPTGRLSVSSDSNTTQKAGQNPMQRSGNVHTQSVLSGPTGRLSISSGHVQVSDADTQRSGRTSRASVGKAFIRQQAFCDSSSRLGKKLPSRHDFTVHSKSQQMSEKDSESDEESSFDNFLDNIAAGMGIAGEQKVSRNGSVLGSEANALDCKKAFSQSRCNSSNSNYEGFKFEQKGIVDGRTLVDKKLKREEMVNGIIERVSVQGSLLEKLNGRRGHDTPLTDLVRCYNGITNVDCTSESVTNGAKNANSASRAKLHAHNGEVTNNDLVGDTSQLNNPALRNGCVGVRRTHYLGLFPQWKNVDALCWLDVILCLLVHNMSVSCQVLAEGFDQTCVLYKLVKAHKQAKLLCSHLQTSWKSASSLTCMSYQGKEMKKNPSSSLCNGISQKCKQTPSRNRVTACTHGSNGTDTDAGRDCCSEGSEYKSDEIKDILNNVREEICMKLKKRLRWERRKPESPVFAMPLLLKDSPEVEQLFKMKYRFQFSCRECGHTEVTSHENVLPTLPAVVEAFNITEPTHPRQCFHCGHKDGKRAMVYQRLPKCLLMHFTEGLADISWSDLQFEFAGSRYEVTGCVQYLKSPDHFVAWLRNPQDNTWMKCDDLQGNICTFSASPPTFPGRQLHIVMWEQIPGNMNPANMNATDAPASRSDSVVRNACDSEKFTKSQTQMCSLSDRRHSYSGNVAQNHKVSTAITRQLSSQARLQPMSASRQQMVDPHRFLTSSILLPASACSPAVAPAVCADSNVKMLPKFVSEVVAGSQTVIRPVPCKIGNASSVLSEGRETSNCQQSLNVSSFTAMRDLEGKRTMESNDGNCEKHSTCVRLGAEINGGNVECSQLRDSRINGPIASIKPSAAFHSVKSKQTTNMDVAVTSTDKSSGPNVPGVRCDSASQSTSTDETNNSAHGTDQLADSNPKPDKPVSESTDNNKFKRPTELFQLVRNKPKATAGISKDAFMVLKLGKNDRMSSPLTSSGASMCSPVPRLNGNMTYLNSVKQYLIGRATGMPESKARFEGLNLKSAPNLSRSTDLTDLKLSRVTPNSLCSLDSRNSVSPASEFFGRKELQMSPSRSVSSGSRKRKASDTHLNSSVPKKKMMQLNGDNGMNGVARELKKSIRSGETITYPSKPASENGYRTNYSVRPFNGDNVRNGSKTVKSSHLKADFSTNGICSKSDIAENWNDKTDAGRNKKHSARSPNGILKSDSSNVKEILRPESVTCDTNVVLKDLYEALNIPFSTAKDTMSDIMDNVSDIFGTVDVADLVSGPALTGSPLKCGTSSPLKCGTRSAVAGNQTNMDWYVVS